MTLIVVIIVALILFVIMMYNGMIKLRNRVKEAWSDIDVQLKRRYNLIPNIVESVKGYAAHEEGVFTKVTEARSNAINATNVKDQGNAENMLSGALKSLFAIAENYPDLKANENFLQLQNELVDTEDKIQSARRFYNSVTRDFNTKIQQFPNSIIANIFKFQEEEFFEIQDEEQKENVEVSFSKKEAPAKPAAPTPTPEPTPVATPEAPAEEAAPAEPTPAEPDEAESEVQAEPEAPPVDHPDQTTLPNMEGGRKEDTPQA
ncbi:LemA family protein [Patescibacteria group bacterium]|nr:LemA family protein [Patescibacteria group bacterium]